MKFVTDSRALRKYSRDYTAYTTGTLSVAAIKRTRGQIRTRVEDWALYADVEKDNFCHNHKKVCRAAVACITSGFSAWATAKAAGGSDRIADLAFAGNCAQAAAAIMFGL